MASRFEQEIARFHGVTPRRVEVFEADDPIRVREVRAARKPTFRDWWRQAPPLERFWRVWLCTVLGVVSIGVGTILGAFLFALLS